jgi:hypothetical protein
MCRKLIIAVLVLASLTVLAITPHLSLFGPNGAEITPATLGAAAWWEPSRPNGYVTNSGEATLANFTAMGSLYNLTNAAGAGSPYLQAGKNGLQSVGFAGATALVAPLYVNTGFTQEVVMVAAFTNGTAKLVFMSPGAPVANHQLTAGGGLLQLKMGATSVTGFSSLANLANKFAVYNILFQGGAGSVGNVVYTNGVSGTAANVSLAATNMSGFYMTPQCPVAVLAMMTWTNRILTAAERLAVYQYCTNRFGVMP